MVNGLSTALYEFVEAFLSTDAAAQSAVLRGRDSAAHRCASDLAPGPCTCGLMDTAVLVSEPCSGWLGSSYQTRAWLSAKGVHTRSICCCHFRSCA